MSTSAASKSEDPLLNSKSPELPVGEDRVNNQLPESRPPIPTHLIVSNVLAYVLNALITYGVGVFGGKTNGELSRKYQTLVTPIGWAFAIWGIIFLAQLVWVLYPVFMALNRRRTTTPEHWVWVQSVGFLYVWVVVLQATWTLVFSYEVIWCSACAMVSLCGLLWCTVWSLRQTLGEQPQALSTPSYLLWIFPFVIHAGWVTAATAVNLNLNLVADDATASVQFGAALASLVLLLFVALWTTTRQSGLDGAMAFPIAWALLGVYCELNTSTDENILERFDSTQLDVAKYGALTFAALIFVVALWKQCSR